MTEAEWLACTDPYVLLTFLRGKVSDRKLRLFACACCRWIWDLYFDDRSRQAVEVAERYADGLADKAECARAYRRASAARWKTLIPGNQGPRYYIAHSACASTMASGDYSATSAALSVSFSCQGEKQAQRLILQDIFGSPFRPLYAFASWLVWRGGTVPKLAQAIYEERAFDRLPILADGLEDAGCDNADILSHCRKEGPHFRGCWVVDLLLGKE
jgi:hypothetical protein